MAKVLVIADSQAPFDHDDYLPFLLAVKEKYKTNITVHVGDEIDHHALGDYDHDPDGYSAGDELSKAIERLKPYYREFPDLLLCESNHTARILKRVFKAGIPIRYMRDFKDVINAPKGWVWKKAHDVDGVIYTHGLGYSGSLGAINCAKDNHQSAVIGHLHADAGILFHNNGRKTIFGMNVGCGIDPSSYAFAYGRECRKKPVLSCGIVIKGKPHIILMNTKHGRWDRKIT